jgi:hypothetical protein
VLPEVFRNDSNFLRDVVPIEPDPAHDSFMATLLSTSFFPYPLIFRLGWNPARTRAFSRARSSRLLAVENGIPTAVAISAKE